MKKTIIAAAALGLGLSIASPAAAIAEPTLYHRYTNDAYEPDILWKCVWADPTLHLFQWDDTYTTYSCSSFNWIYIRAGEELWCYRTQAQSSTYYWDKSFDGTGWHEVPNTWRDGAGCKLNKD